MSNTGNQPPRGTPPTSKPGGDDSPPSSQATPAPAADASQTPPASSPVPDSSLPASTGAPASTPPDSAPASAPAPAANSKADSKPPDSPPTSDASPPSSQAPDSKPPDSDGCAEIPTAAHAVLTAEVTLAVQVPYTLDQANQMPHKFTLANDDNSYSQTLSLASDAQAGDTDGTCFVLFKDLTENHTYTLQCDDGSGTTSTMFQAIDYDKLVDTLSASGSAPPSSNPSPPPASGST